jgi:hypothetical protein
MWWCAFLHAEPGLSSASDRFSIPPDDGAVPGRRSPARWRTRPNIRVVFARAVVKIYHGRNVDRPGGMWRRTQEEADKRRPECAKAVSAVT